MLSSFRLRRTGVLAPGDPAPPPGYSGFLDYRHVVDSRAFRGRRAGPFTLGRVVDLRRARPAAPVGLFQNEIERHVAVVGPSGAGKTHGLLIPWIVAALREGASVVAIDVKGDLLDDLDLYRRRAGGRIGCKVARLDYMRPRESVGWNWVDELRDPRGRADPRSIAGAVEAILGRQKPSDPQPFFYQQDVLILQGLLELVATSSKGHVTAGTVLSLVSNQLELERVVNKYAGVPGAHRLASYVATPPADYAKATSGVRVALSELAQGPLEAVTSTPGLFLRRVVDEPYLVVVTAPLGDGRLSEAFSGLFLNRLAQLIYERLSGAAGHHVFLVVDEAARLAERVRYEELVSVGRSAGVTVVLAFQDVSQVRDEGERSAILSNCSTYVSLAGVSQKSAEFLSGRLGQVPAPQRSESVSRRDGTRLFPRRDTTRSFTSELAPILGLREIMAPPFGRRSAIVHTRDLSDRPFIVDLTRS